MREHGRGDAADVEGQASVPPLRGLQWELSCEAGMEQSEAVPGGRPGSRVDVRPCVGVHGVASLKEALQASSNACAHLHHSEGGPQAEGELAYVSESRVLHPLVREGHRQG